MGVGDEDGVGVRGVVREEKRMGVEEVRMMWVEVGVEEVARKGGTGQRAVVDNKRDKSH